MAKILIETGLTESIKEECHVEGGEKEIFKLFVKETPSRCEQSELVEINRCQQPLVDSSEDFSDHLEGNGTREEGYVSECF